MLRITLPFFSGSGKSNVMEAVAFGLGASLTELRVKCLKDLSSDSTQDDIRTLVRLAFQQSEGKDNQLTIGSNIICGQRLFFINNNSKVTKTR